MRRCGLWISAQVKQDEERIIDTSLRDDVAEFMRLRDPDPMPADMILVVVHPARYQQLRMIAAEMRWPMPFGLFDDPNGAYVAGMLISQRCRGDLALQRRWRWPGPQPPFPENRVIKEGREPG